MDPSTASFKRFWEPSFLQTMGLTFLAGTIATTATHPLDFLKTVIQLRSEGVGFRGHKITTWGYNPFKIVREMHATGEGLMQFYKGFEANLYGRLGYLGIRNAIYKIVYDLTKPVKPTNDLMWWEKAAIGGIAGSIAAYVTAPFTIVSIRQILDTQINLDWRRNYASTSEGLNKVKAEGAVSKGVWYHVGRSFLLNAAMTGPYDFFREALFTRFGDYGFVQPLALISAAFVGAAVTLPIDNLRTRVMQAFAEPERNRMNYTGLVEMVSKSMIYERTPVALWAGFLTYWASTTIYAGLTIGITEAFTESWKRKAGLLEWQI